MRRTPKNSDLEADKIKTTIGLQACPVQIFTSFTKKIKESMKMTWRKETETGKILNNIQLLKVLSSGN